MDKITLRENLSEMLFTMIQDKYIEFEYDYEKFVHYLFSIEKYLGKVTVNDICQVFKSNVIEPEKQIEFDEFDNELEPENYLFVPKHNESLTQAVKEKGWINEDIEENIVNSYYYKGLFKENQKLELSIINDITQNSLHILGRCNDPKNWGESKQGMVMGMVQSGKTISMLSLMSQSMAVGYNFFIFLTGSKESLRIQTQERIKETFGLKSGWYENTSQNVSINSPTYNSGYSYIPSAGPQTILPRKTKELTNPIIIITILKEKSNLKKLNEHLKEVKEFCNYENINFDELYNALILDDESDNAGLDIAKDSILQGINEQLVILRDSIKKNCYVGYTATPQGCLAADLNNKVGYPKDFLWLLEPMKEPTDARKNLSYMGLNEFFLEYETYLLKSLSKDSWPHHVKDETGKRTGVYDPLSKEILKEADLNRLENDYADYLNNNIKEIPQEFIDAIIVFIIGAGIRWYRHFLKNNIDYIIPTLKDVNDKYPYHAMMFNLSLTINNHEKTRNLLSSCWKIVKLEYKYWIENKQSRFSYLIEEQFEKTRKLKSNDDKFDLEILNRFIDLAISITEAPIYGSNDKFIYLLNSSNEGDSLNYYDDDKRRQTKKCAIFLGGNILSRGLTIENLSVSVFIRTQSAAMGDTNLQMCRWFGHKKKDIDLLSLYLTDNIRGLFKDITRCDDALRVSIRNSIIEGKSPDKVLIELWSSNFFSITSPRKRKLLIKQKNSAISFSGKAFYLKQPFCNNDEALLNDNNINFESFLDQLVYDKKNSNWLERGVLYNDVNPNNLINFFKEKFIISKDAQNISPLNYAYFLEDWNDGFNKKIISTPLPKINIGIIGDINQRQRAFDVKPKDELKAKLNYKDSISSLMGGGRTSAGKPYLGDRFFDKDQDWHKVEKHKQIEYRAKYEPILILFYKLNPNYIVKINKQVVDLKKGDKGFLNLNSVLTFAAITPIGGPNYKVYSNDMINPL